MSTEPCKHDTIHARGRTGWRWLCDECGEPFEPVNDSLARSVGYDVVTMMGKPLDYWFKLDSKLQALEAEKYALEQRLAAVAP